MNLKDFFEHIQFDLVLEGIGTIFAFALLWNILFKESISQLFELFIYSIC